MSRERMLEAVSAARRAAVAGAPAWVRTGIALARRRPEAVLAAGLVTGVATMVAHWM